MVRTRLGKRFGAMVAASALVLGATVVTTTLSGSAGAASSKVRPLPALPMPAGTFIKCTQISGTIKMNPGIGLTGTSSGVKWTLTGLANNCTVGGAYTGTILGALIKGTGYFVGGNTCANAAVAANYGASTLKIKWFAAPAAAPTTYSTVATGAFLAPTLIDSTGFNQNRNHTGTSPVSLILGGDWTPASATQLGTDCSGAAPASRLLSFGTPAGSHMPAFGASI